MGWDSVFGVGILLRDSICLDFPPKDILDYSWEFDIFGFPFRRYTGLLLRNLVYPLSSLRRILDTPEDFISLDLSPKDLYSRI